MIDVNDEFNNDDKFLGNNQVQVHMYIGNYQVFFKFLKITTHKYLENGQVPKDCDKKKYDGNFQVSFTFHTIVKHNFVGKYQAHLIPDPQECVAQVHHKFLHGYAMYNYCICLNDLDACDCQ